jgi:hypothetical protein
VAGGLDVASWKAVSSGGKRRARLTLVVTTVLVAGCSGVDPLEPSLESRGQVRVELGPGLIGVADAPAPETDQTPRFELFYDDRALGITALDATVDPLGDTIAWIDPELILWVAPVIAPQQQRWLASRAVLGLAASEDRLAYAVRIDGPDTAAFVADLRTLNSTPLSDAPGPDEVLALSPDGTEVLLLSGRTGLASLFAADIDSQTARQLTNHGLAPGQDLDVHRVVPPPVDRRSVRWNDDEIEYASGSGPIRVAVAEVTR